MTTLPNMQLDTAMHPLHPLSNKHAFLTLAPRKKRSCTRCQFASPASPRAYRTPRLNPPAFTYIKYPLKIAQIAVTMVNQSLVQDHHQALEEYRSPDMLFMHVQQHVSHVPIRTVSHVYPFQHVYPCSTSRSTSFNIIQHHSTSFFCLPRPGAEASLFPLLNISVFGNQSSCVDHRTRTLRHSFSDMTRPLMTICGHHTHTAHARHTRHSTLTHNDYCFYAAVCRNPAWGMPKTVCVKTFDTWQPIYQRAQYFPHVPFHNVRRKHAT